MQPVKEEMQQPQVAVKVEEGLRHHLLARYCVAGYPDRHGYRHRTGPGDAK